MFTVTNACYVLKGAGDGRGLGLEAQHPEPTLTVPRSQEADTDGLQWHALWEGYKA